MSLQSLVADRDRQLQSKDTAASSLSENLRLTENELLKEHRQSATLLEELHNVRLEPRM